MLGWYNLKMINCHCDICKKSIKKDDVCVCLSVSAIKTYTRYDICNKCIKSIPKLLSKILKKEKGKTMSKK